MNIYVNVGGVDKTITLSELVDMISTASIVTPTGGTTSEVGGTGIFLVRHDHDTSVKVTVDTDSTAHKVVTLASKALIATSKLNAVVVNDLGSKHSEITEMLDLDPCDYPTYDEQHRAIEDAIRELRTRKPVSWSIYKMYDEIAEALGIDPYNHTTVDSQQEVIMTRIRALKDANAAIEHDLDEAVKWVRAVAREANILFHDADSVDSLGRTLITAVSSMKRQSGVLAEERNQNGVQLSDAHAALDQIVDVVLPIAKRFGSGSPHHAEQIAQMDISEYGEGW